MNQYKNITQFLALQNVVVQACQTDQIVALDDVVAYCIRQNSTVAIQHQLMRGEQKIYLFIEQGAIAAFISCEPSDYVIDRSDLELVVVIEEDAQFFMQFSLLHALKATGVIKVYLQGDRSKAEIKGLYALDATQQILINTYQYHLGRNSQSDVVIKGMVKGDAYAQYHGLIKIEQLAQGAKASQENKNIVLSAGAKVVSVPSIEVLQQDVQCYHGSAIGRFDQNALWYLQSKGFLLEQAQEFLIRSFFQEVLVEGSQHQNEIMDAICQKMI